MIGAGELRGIATCVNILCTVFELDFYRLGSFPSYFLWFPPTFIDISLAGGAYPSSPRQSVGQPANTRKPHDFASRHRHTARFKGENPSSPSQHGFWRSRRHVVWRTVSSALFSQGTAKGRHSIHVLCDNVCDHNPCPR